jgi:hypothetical protein
VSYKVSNYLFGLFLTNLLNLFELKWRCHPTNIHLPKPCANQ